MTADWGEHPGYLTFELAMLLYGHMVRDAKHMRQLAYHRRWRSYTLDGRVRWHAWDVDACFHPEDYDTVDGRLRPTTRSGTVPPRVDRPVGEHSPDDQHQHGDACPEPGCSDEETP